MQNRLESDIIGYIERARQDWETGTAFITEKVAFMMRDLIRQLRKNYWGVFDDPIDPNTGRDKIWIPLTEATVDTVVKSIDMDTKDIKLYARKPNRNKLSKVIREYIKSRLDANCFGQTLNNIERTMAIDGTCVVKVIETERDGKAGFEIKIVDLLNFYIDPTAESIEKTEFVIERSVMTPDELMGYKDWMNTENILGSENLSRYDGEYGNGVNNYSMSGTTKLVDVWEAWGKIPKSFITGDRKDQDEKIEGRIVISGLDTTDKRVHLVEKSEKKLKPYEEFWYEKIANRWYGKGVAEKLQMLQLWMNIIVNIRINRSYVSQLGLFKIRKNSGITPQMLSRLSANGVIPVNNMDDIEQMVVQEASQASYNDENIINDWAQRTTSAFEVVTGEQIPATTTATVGAIQSRSAQSQFALIMEGMGLSLERVFRNHVLPIVNKNLKNEDVIRISLDGAELDEFNKQLAEAYLYKYLKNSGNQSVDINQAYQKALEKVEKGGSMRYVKLLKECDISEFDITFSSGSEAIDENILIQNLINIMKIAPEYKDILLTQTLDALGITVSLPQRQMLAAQQGQAEQAQSPEQQMQEAVTLPQAQVPQAL